MDEFLSIPYIPCNQITTALVGREAKPFEIFFENFGIKLIYIDTNPNLKFPISNHVDCHVFPCMNNLFFTDSSQSKIIPTLKSLGAKVHFIKQNVSNGYPNDVKLNGLMLNHTLICNPKTFDLDIQSYVKSLNYDIIPCKQGYVKCSTIPVSKDALITDDESIFRALSKKFDVLFVQKGDVELQTFPYGFIGGACTMISQDCLFCLGDLKTHRNYKNIKSFLRNHNIYIQNASKGHLQDIGSIIPILERSAYHETK